jgi:hypothetical protein
MTMVDRDTRYIVSWRVVWERTVAVAQDRVDTSPPTRMPCNQRKIKHNYHFKLKALLGANHDKT